MNQQAFDVYLDESGNTGVDLLNREQPVYVLTGWAVSRRSVQAAEAVVTTAYASLQGNYPERKGKDLLRSLRGQSVMSRILDGLISLGCIPIYVIFE